MPNHVTHKFTVTGCESELKRFRETCFSKREDSFEKDRLEFDFDSLVPRPEILDKTISGNSEEMKTEAYKQIEAEAIALTGHKNWYNWSCAYWGTKWNAYHTHLDDDYSNDQLELQFDTAWSCPEPIFVKVAEMFPKLSFEGYALDEGYGFGAEITIESGDFYIDYFDVNPGFMEAFIL